MVESRPDWLISRQRAWGSPIAMFVDKSTGEPLVDPEVNARIVELIGKEGADAWFSRPARDFLGNRDPDQYEKVDDILDVWFDSGSTHAFTLESRSDSHWPADLYSEGSDQHRGWFQLSLLEACGTRGRAPFRAIMTHGFTLDEKGEKMSKSLGNSVEPQDIAAESGAEILRRSSATCCTACGSWMQRRARPSRPISSRMRCAIWRSSAPTTSPPCSSTSAAMLSIATGRTRCGGARAARSCRWLSSG
jgi:isoleucyl-tRNA synthetase